MKQRTLGPFSVSAIGLGCMNLSHAYGAPVSAEQGERVLLAAREQHAREQGEAAEQETGGAPGGAGHARCRPSWDHRAPRAATPEPEGSRSRTVAVRRDRASSRGRENTSCLGTYRWSFFRADQRTGRNG